jgi:aminoglycoside 6'-N-acetyltransferase I
VRPLSSAPPAGRGSISAPVTFHIRHVQRADATAWAALRALLWPDEDPDLLAAEAARFVEGRPPRGAGMPEAVLVAVESSARATLLGFAELSRRAYAEGCDTSPVGFLEGWFVVAERRRQGIGRALVRAAEAWARALGCREFASDALADKTVSARAHQALGFDEVAVVRCFRKPLEPNAGR